MVYLNAGTRYFFRVRSENEKGTSVSGRVGQVTTSEMTIPDANYVLECPEEGGFVQLGEAKDVAAVVPQKMTVEAWVKPEVDQDWAGFVGVIENSDIAKKGWLLGNIDGKLTFCLSGKQGVSDENVGTLTFLTVDKKLPVGEWSHVAGVYNGNEMQLFVNGELKNSSKGAAGNINYPLAFEASEVDSEGGTDQSTETGNAVPSIFAIGAYIDSNVSYRFQGKISEVRLWNTDRSPEAIQKNRFYRQEISENLVGYWRCDRGSGEQIRDFAGGLVGHFQEQAHWADGDELRLFRKLDDIVQLAHGFSFVLALKQDGTAWSWGGNQFGRLGDGSYRFREAPVPVRGTNGKYLGGIQAVAAGNFHALALKRDGVVLAWGANDFGQLGNGSLEDSHVPIKVARLSKVCAIACGANQSYALKKDGTVWSWGHNDKGQLGINSTTNSHVPVQVVAARGSGFLSGIKAISAGFQHTLALAASGTIQVWGDNTHCQLGNGTTTSSSLPIGLKDQNKSDVKGIGKIEAGAFHSLALEGDNGNVWSWGRNDQGQLAQGTNGVIKFPERIKGSGGWPLNKVTQISAGYDHSLALKANGEALAWGGNDMGHLVDGTTEKSNTPIALWQDKPALSLVGAGHRMSVSVYQDGTLEHTSFDSREIVDVSAFHYHTLAIKKDGTVWAWGQNNEGQQGNGGTTDQGVPHSVQTNEGSGALKDVATVSTGIYHCLALEKKGSLLAWGQGAYGNLGDNTNKRGVLPSRVKSNDNKSELSGVVAAVAGGHHNLALDKDGKVWAWGYNGYGNLGDASTGHKWLPTPVRNLTNIVKIHGGYHHSLAIRDDGTVWAWGRNSQGCLGDGSASNRTTPVQVKGASGKGFLTDVVDLATGDSFSLALKKDGTVVAWGYNGNGELGNNSTATSYTPVPVRGENNKNFLENIIALAAGANHILALAEDGTVWTWGYNGYGNLGNGTTNARRTPGGVRFQDGTSRLSGIVKISSGWQWACALQSNGQIWTWGRQCNGALGNGTTADGSVRLPFKLPRLG